MASEDPSSDAAARVNKTDDSPSEAPAAPEDNPPPAAAVSSAAAAVCTNMVGHESSAAEQPPPPRGPRQDFFVANLRGLEDETIVHYFTMFGKVFRFERLENNDTCAYMTCAAAPHDVDQFLGYHYIDGTCVEVKFDHSKTPYFGPSTACASAFAQKRRRCYLVQIF